MAPQQIPGMTNGRQEAAVTGRQNLRAEDGEGCAVSLTPAAKILSAGDRERRGPPRTKAVTLGERLSKSLSVQASEIQVMRHRM